MLALEYGTTQRQQFDLPQPILSLGGQAKVLLLGMAQRQTLPESFGETANHYHICISYASLVGTVLLSCHLAGGVVEDRGKDGSSGEAGGGEGGGSGGAAGRSAATGRPVAGGGGGGRGLQSTEKGKKQRGLYLQWEAEEFESEVVFHGPPAL